MRVGGLRVGDGPSYRFQPVTPSGRVRLEVLPQQDESRIRLPFQGEVLIDQMEGGPVRLAERQTLGQLLKGLATDHHDIIPDFDRPSRSCSCDETIRQDEPVNTQDTIERAASIEELAAVRRVLDLNGVAAGDELRGQLEGLKVRPGCTCGCASMDLVPEESALPSATTALEIGANILDEDQALVGFALLFLQAGRLDRLEFASVREEPISAVPTPELLVSDR